MRGCFGAVDGFLLLPQDEVGEPRVRFDSNERYQNFPSVEQLLHWQSDLSMAHDYKARCARENVDFSIRRALRARSTHTRPHLPTPQPPQHQLTVRLNATCELPASS